MAYSSLTPEAVAFSKELQTQGVKVPVVAGLQNWGEPEIVLAKDALGGWVSAGLFDEDATDTLTKSVTERFAKLGEADPAVGKPVSGPLGPRIRRNSGPGRRYAQGPDNT